MTATKKKEKKEKTMKNEGSNDLPPTRDERESLQDRLAARSVLSLRLPEAKKVAVKKFAEANGYESVSELVEDLIDEALARGGKGGGKPKK